ncbi:endo-1,4-beta-xylanase [Cellulophaga sp. E16_2]|uniref:Beta-xylanase n=1 Tax=Cellulophaga algicola (strain DSM 14237 / IC166 / ACAM 630) TaxID=688270 RepID=E6X3M9_CELAD|nr:MULTISPECIES: endo-1,4-beta-xylanase [Cellulophaga]ADV48182.1 Endo-1,4-beta-xylanase [Cellulophaga algicola DSM 14237]MBO0590607.1 endo-1,4-beta-xylanase [Cellulophaga sp. E16_2]
MLRIAPLFLMFLTFFSCKTEKKEVENQTKEQTPISLKNAFADDFYVGAAINSSHINKTDTLGLNLVTKEYNTITPENIMKWMYLHPAKDTFFFDEADAYVNLGLENDMHIVGHTLVWHSQIADWMNTIKDSTEMATIIKHHVKTIVSRYKGKIDSWDVVNEALNEDGSFRTSLLYNVMGDSYLEIAFTEAAKADPEASLVYNDYNLWKPEKREGVVRLVKKLQAKGVKIDGIGMQGHYSIPGPTLKDIEDSIEAFAALGVKVMFTELDITALPNPWELDGAAVEQDYSTYEGDITMNPYADGMNDSINKALSVRYKDLFSLFLKHKEAISRVTFWGVTDRETWLNDWPINGRTNYPLLFDRAYQPKDAYHEIIALKQNN